MTIIKNKNSAAAEQSNLLIFFLMVVFAVSSGAAIFLYSQAVEARHEISAIKVDLRSAEIENAELKNALNEMTSTGKIREIAGQLNLMVDKNPSFIKNIQLVKN